MIPTIVLIDQSSIGDRFRKELGDITGLAKSIQEHGLLQPVILSENYQLIAGERRLQACKSLGGIEIPITIVNLQDIVKGDHTSRQGKH
jgi:ParB family chromosome partitioning protein